MTLIFFQMAISYCIAHWVYGLCKSTNKFNWNEMNIKQLNENLKSLSITIFVRIIHLYLSKTEAKTTTKRHNSRIFNNKLMWNESLFITQIRVAQLNQNELCICSISINNFHWNCSQSTRITIMIHFQQLSSKHY